MDGILQQMQSNGERQVKQAKEAKKQAVLIDADKNLRQYIAGCDDKLKPMQLAGIIGEVVPDWAGAVKNKRTIEGLINSVDTELARCKVEICKVMDRVIPNIQYLRDNAADYKFLFSDAHQLVNNAVEPFQATIKSRIAEHKKAEGERLETERNRIKKEEQDKAQREAELRAEASRDRIRKEERAKVQAEEQAKREQEERAKVQAEEQAKREQEERAKVEVKMKESYRIATVEEKIALGYFHDSELLIGPQDFTCFLGEPEDRTWSRDGEDVVTRLNEQHKEINALKERTPDGPCKK